MTANTGSSSLVSIIIPCHNGEAFLREAVDSALAQTYDSVEVVVVDDGSTDESVAIMQSYGSAINIVQQTNAGAAAARNRGWRVSKGDYLVFLDADDYISDEYITRMLAALQAADGDIAYCGWQNTGLRPDRCEPFVPPDYENEPAKQERLIENARWPIHAALIRRELVETNGGFDTRWGTCEDFALWIEIATDACLVRVKDVLAFYRHHGHGQTTADRARIARDHWLVQQSYIHRHPDVRSRIGKKKLRSITHGELLRRGYVCYWDRDLECARRIFRLVMKSGYGGIRDWLYMLPSLLPLALHRKLISTMSRKGMPAA